MTAAGARGSSASASVRPVVVLALVLATAMLALPTSRGADGALAWWWSEGALSVSVRGLSAVAVLVLWITAFLPPEPVRGAVIAATAAVMSLATGLAIGSVGAHALPAVLLVPMSAILVALDSAGSPGARIAAGASIGLSVIAAGAAIVLAVLSPAAWGFVAMGLTVAASGSLAFAGVRGSGSAAGGAVFWGAVGASCGAVGALFAVSLGALAGEVGVDAARGATTAGLVLAFAAISWAAVHESNAH